MRIVLEMGRTEVTITVKEDAPGQSGQSTMHSATPEQPAAVGAEDAGPAPASLEAVMGASIAPAGFVGEAAAKADVRERVSAPETALEAQDAGPAPALDGTRAGMTSSPSAAMGQAFFSGEDDAIDAGVAPEISFETPDSD
ncbi:MAG TPA: hypothetical protein VEW94_01010 [Chloroflexia bacterium]|nr:hypothetical protein [Chloroflexia bacterium]